ncbi:MAG: rod shape-determining protein MreC [Bacilli bacterium]|nr:rod shape-determining protein MreC [Bacilli bacterium]
MYGKKRKNKKVVVVLLSIVFVFVLLFFSLKLGRHMGVIEGGLKDFSILIEKIVMYPFTELNSDKGVDQSKSYLIQKNVNSSMANEIEELKDALDLNRTLTEYKPINTTVLSRNKSYWFNTITVDKGSSSGIKVDMAVVTKNGFVGKVSKVSKYSSEVKLITSADVNYKVSVSITTNDGDTYAILSGYNKKTNTVKVTGVDKSSDVQKGDVVLTSGLGGLFPRGIYIGTVESIVRDKYDLSKTLYIKTSQDFNNIHYVTILKENG